MAQADPVLDLSTNAPEIRINGDLYPLRLSDDISIVQNSETAKKFARMDALRAKKHLSLNDARELARLADETCRIVLDAPPAVQAKLSGMQRLRIVTAFFQHLVGNEPTLVARKAKLSTPAN